MLRGWLHRLELLCDSMTTRQVELPLDPAAAWPMVLRAADSTGKVKESVEAAHYLTLKSRYGLEAVHLRVAVLSGPTPNTSILEIQGHGDDIWGVASRKVMDKLIGALSAT
jgi:hypothetical protein